jgi:DNA modification methylase
LGEYTIKQRDYLDTLKACEEQGGADLIATSPPYANARTYGMDCSFTDADYQRLAHGLWSALRPGGHALINLDAPVRDWTGDGRGTERGLHPWRFMLYAHDVVGFRVPDRLAFGRDGIPGDFWGFRNDWEPLIWLQKPGADGHRPNHDAISDQVAAWQTHAKGSRGRRPTGVTGKDEGVNSIRSGNTRRRGTLWVYGNAGNNHTGAPDIEEAGHPARWPYKLARDIVVCFCPVNGIVCDPFLGAGTTMIAALEEGRRFIGGDLGARQTDGRPWVDVAADLWAARQRQGRLF